MNNKLKVAHVIRVFSYGGAEVLLREVFIHSTFKENVISDLYILDHKKLGLVADVKPHIRKIHYYKITSLLFIVEYIKFLNHIIKEHYDVIHMHLPVAGWLTIPAKLFSRKTKFIYSEHNLVNFYTKYNYYLSGLVYGFFDCVINVSHEVSEVTRKIQKKWFFKTKKAVTILNGINTDKFSNTHRSGEDTLQVFTVGLVARFRPQKRVDRWVEVAFEVYKIYPETKFLMVGDGPDDNMLREKIEDLGMKEKIELPGMLADTVNTYKQIDVFLLTSDFEGLPLVIMEAMSTGCVPVISNVGGIKQLFFNNFGYKFDVFNANTIANVIANYHNNPQMFKSESDKAREFVVKNYSLGKQVNEIISLYRNIIND